LSGVAHAGAGAVLAVAAAAGVGVGVGADAVTMERSWMSWAPHRVQMRKEPGMKAMVVVVESMARLQFCELLLFHQAKTSPGAAERV